jgi:AcrR family transcriptional regulator
VRPRNAHAGSRRIPATRRQVLIRVRAALNRERILDVAAQLITEHGYTKLTASTIAEHDDLPERAAV